MSGRIVISMGLIAAALVAPVTQAADLLDVYQRALQSDPVLREAEANRLAALEAKPSALSQLLPQFNGTGAASRSEADGSRTITQADDTTGVVQNITATTSTDSDTLQYQLRLTQAVFRWDRWVALKQANSQVAQAEADYQAAQQDLILRASQRYFDVLAARDTLQSETTARDAISRQLEQAEKRFEVGLIAITDVQEAKAAFDTGNAAVISAKRNLATTQELLRELTGDFLDVLATPADSMPLKTPDPQNEDQWVSTAMEQNLALTSSRLAAEIARDTVRIRRAGHLPSLDLVLTRGDFDTDATDVNTIGSVITRAPADSQQTTDTISLQVTVPFYSGGATQSAVREAVYRHRAARERLERTARQTERETRDAFLGVQSEISRVQALKQSLESSRTALQATEAGYEVGTRTTVDVLDARRRLAEAETNYARSRYDYIINVIRLKLAAGILKPEDVREINGWLSVPAPVTPPAPATTPTESPPATSAPPSAS